MNKEFKQFENPILVIPGQAVCARCFYKCNDLMGEHEEIINEDNADDNPIDCHA